MIRLIIVFLVACFVGLFIQAALVHSSVPAAAAPDFILVLVVIIALNYQTVPGMLGAFCLGLLADFASGQFVGPNAAGAIVAFSFVGILASRVYADKGLAVMVITFLSSLAKSAVYALMHALYVNGATDELMQMKVFQLILLEALLSGLVAPIVIRLLSLTKPSSHGAMYR